MTENLPGDQLFDFEAHRRTAITQYQPARPLYESFAQVVKSILTEALSVGQIKVATVEARAKTLDSFGDKAADPKEDDPEMPKYPDPLADIEEVDKAELLLREARLGYQSIHYIARLQPNRTSLPEYARYNGLKVEIQLRTVLQHAWAEIEHDIQYKSAETIPAAIRRRFTSLAGLLEIADREFQAVQEEDELLRHEARRAVELGELDEVEITGDALNAYLDQKLGPDGRMTIWNYLWTASMLGYLGFSNFRQIDQALALYDDDAVSRAMSGTRFGQIRRFELVLLASMGQEFIERHPWADELWWYPWKERQLQQLRTNGITIGSYVPDPIDDPVQPSNEPR